MKSTNWRYNWRYKSPIVNVTKERQLANQFVVLDVTRKVKLRITVQKQTSESEHNNSKKESNRPVRSNVQPFCRPNGSIGMGSSLEESNLYIKINIHEMHAKLLVDTGATLAFMSKTLFETIPTGNQAKTAKFQAKLFNCKWHNGRTCIRATKSKFFFTAGIIFSPEETVIFWLYTECWRRNQNNLSRNSNWTASWVRSMLNHMKKTWRDKAKI